ncbi:PilZ domain-containing protein [Vibrio methylphosphonaticus]|uniref:PilZ domain-containing protein n=1 Tax=Vibrio methylphosphonaticus TaxID=2946866 RepID=UPI002029F637|nr:PilZ domain-containing protein [Vibrio methylphosphonaticus]MCL9773438.1 flagellar brake protein [Vibrio methylphosphonaticus]
MGQTLSKPQDYYRYLKPGMRLSLSINGSDQIKGIASILIGYKMERFISVDVSGIDDDLLNQLVDKELVVRGLTDSSFGHVIAFKCHWMAFSDVVCKQLYLSIPERVVSKPIREHSRYKLALPCNVSFGQANIDGQVIDFSVSGCGIYTEQSHDFCKGLEVKVETALNRFLPGSLTCEVVSIKKQGAGSLIGIQFNQQILMSNALKNALAEMSMQVT